MNVDSALSITCHKKRNETILCSSQAEKLNSSGLMHVKKHLINQKNFYRRPPLCDPAIKHYI